MNYDENKYEKILYIIFLCRGSLRHVIYFKSSARVKRLRNAALDHREDAIGVADRVMLASTG